MKRLLILLVSLPLLWSCGGQSGKQAAADSKSAEVEVLYFHGKQRCVTCKTIEKLAREVVEDSFGREVREGKVAFRVIDISSSDGAAEAEKYEVAWSSLLVVSGGKAENLTSEGFKYAKSQPDLFKSRLEESVAAKLD